MCILSIVNQSFHDKERERLRRTSFVSRFTHRNWIEIETKQHKDYMAWSEEPNSSIMQYTQRSLIQFFFFFFTFLDINVTKPCFSRIISQTAQKNKRRENTSTRGYFNILKRNLSCLNYIVSVSRKTKKKRHSISVLNICDHMTFSWYYVFCFS